LGIAVEVLDHREAQNGRGKRECVPNYRLKLSA
jgi:hypothetical protein